MERNRETLIKALEQLPDYSPPDQIWSGVEQGLAKQEITELADRLPAYSPPPSVWNQINRNLEEEASPMRARIRQLRPLLSIAASLLLLVAAGAYFILKEPAPKVAMSYSEETITPIAITVDWNEEEPQFEAIISQLKQYSSNPKLNEMRLELEELNSAKEEVKTILNAYGGRDADLINQLGEIERERSALYRELIKHI